MSGQTKKHDATSRHVKKSREEGQVAPAKDVIHAVVVLALVELTVQAGGWAMQALDALCSLMFGLPAGGMSPFAQLQAATAVSALLVVPPIALGAVLIVASGLLLNGFLFAPKALRPSLGKISPLGTLKGQFSGQGLSRFALSMVKLVMFLSLSVWFIVARRHDLLNVWRVDVHSVLPAVSALTAPVARGCALAFFVVAAIDYAIGRFWHMKGLRMTDEELKRDHRDSDGDPWVRAHLAALRRLLSQEEVQQAGTRPDVVLANPTHFAIGLVYRRDRDDAPRILVKRTEAQALDYIDRARRDGVPILRSPAFTRALYRAGEESQPIPGRFFEPVAIVYKIVEALRAAHPAGDPLELDIPADVFAVPAR